jgi:1,4-alpha-glucan branching enzyme
MTRTLSGPEIDAIVNGDHGDPFRVLGPHAPDGAAAGTVIRAFLPEAAEAWVVERATGCSIGPLSCVDPRGLFEAAFAGRSEPFPPYRLRITDTAGVTTDVDDPYAFAPILTEDDLRLIHEGTHYRSYDRLGAHLREVAGVRGVHFAVWAPNARRVSVVGDFNRWDGRRHPMRRRAESGVWELFLPGLGEGERYKFEVKGADGALQPLKADPYGFAFELRPATASIVADLDAYRWLDDDWLAARRHEDPLRRPIAIYEVHLGSWRQASEEGGRFLTYRELAPRLAEYVKAMGYTHVELLPVTEHPLDGSWGYQPTGYFAPTSRFGTPADFMAFVDHLHQQGIGVILDWVPAHFPRDGHGLACFDGTHLYEHADPRQREHREWGTLVFNYGRLEVANFLLSNALFWLERYHVDGLRVDAVASMLYLDYSRAPGEWVPNAYGGRENLEAIAFLRRFNELAYRHDPGVLTIAEESTAWPMVSRPTYLGGLGFGFKWNMGWMHDTLGYMSLDPIYRRHHHDRLTFGLLYFLHENFVLSLSHDEVVHLKGSLLTKMPGDLWQTFANLRAYYTFMYGHPGKKLLFMGGEFGQWREWDHDRSLDWHLLDPAASPDARFHQGLEQLVRDLNRLYRREPALFEADYEPGGFKWIDCGDWEQSIIAFLRRGGTDAEPVVFVLNFTPVPRHGYRVGVPAPGRYAELLNSDATAYGGSGVGNFGAVTAEAVPWHGRPWSLALTLPPLGGLVLKRAEA